MSRYILQHRQALFTAHYKRAVMAELGYGQ
jgi:hypothetical protein